MQPFAIPAALLCALVPGYSNMPITPSCCFPARHAAYFCSDVMSKQMKAIGYGRQSQESQQLGQLLLCPALPCCFWQTNNIFGNKQKFMPPNPDPSCLFSSLLTLPLHSWKHEEYQIICNNCHHLQLKPKLLKRGSSRQQQPRRRLQRGVAFSIRLSAVLIFRGKAARARHSWGSGTPLLGSKKIKM